MLSRSAAIAFGVVDALTSALIVFAVFVALPARYGPVDVAAGALAVVEGAGAVALFVAARSGGAERWAIRAARIAASVALAGGVLAVALLATTAGWLWGVYGSVGRGGAIILGLSAALALPYLVVLPAAQLVWLASDRRASSRKALAAGAALAALLALLAAAVHHAFALEIRAPGRVVASAWSGGALVGRAVARAVGEPLVDVDTRVRQTDGATRVDEVVVAEGRMLTSPEPAFALSLVSGHDGIAVTFDGRTEYLTVDDLLARQAYDRGVVFPDLALSAGVDVPVVLAMAAERFDTTAHVLLERARFRRVRMARARVVSADASANGLVRSPADPAGGERPEASAEALALRDARVAALSAAAYLARGVDGDGAYRYLVDAPSNRTLPGYDWPRHAGATYFLAQAAALGGDAAVADAARRAASKLRRDALARCGADVCVADGPVADLGSTALAVLAFAELARTGVDASGADLVASLAAFLRSQQRSDGEFMHLYDRDARRARDVQYLYFSGEAALALSRAHALTGDARDLDAAARSVAYLAGPAWSFFGSRYYFGEEHWTCQAMEDLWDRAPSRAALDFCLRWQAFNRKLQYRAGDTPYDADGAYGVGPWFAPRLTPVGSRAEAAVATLDAARRAGISGEDGAEIAALEDQIRRSLALLVRQQFRPGPTRPTYLFVSPSAVAGAMPGSEVDWQLRIDYAQHMGSALIRWLSLSPRVTGG